MSFKAVHENEILAKISEFTVLHDNYFYIHIYYCGLNNISVSVMHKYI